MSPEMVSRTVQVRVRPPLPASTGPSSDTSVSTSREPGGTGERCIYIHDVIHNVYCNGDLPVTCIVTVSVYTVVPATALHESTPVPVSHLSLKEWYSTTVWSVVLANTVDDWSLHSIEDTCALVIQLMVADWPTVRGCSRLDIVIPVFKYI